MATGPPRKGWITPELFVQFRKIIEDEDAPGTTIMSLVRRSQVRFPTLSERILEEYLTAARYAAPEVADAYITGKVSFECIREIGQGINDHGVQKFILEGAIANGWTSTQIGRIKSTWKSSKGRMPMGEIVAKALTPWVKMTEESKGPREERRTIPAADDAQGLVASVGRLCAELRIRIDQARSAIQNAPSIDRGAAHRSVFDKCSLLRHFVKKHVEEMSSSIDDVGSMKLREHLEDQLKFLDETVDGYLAEIMKHVASTEELTLLKKEFPDADDGSREGREEGARSEDAGVHATGQEVPRPAGQHPHA